MSEPFRPPLLLPRPVRITPTGGSVPVPREGITVQGLTPDELQAFAGTVAIRPRATGEAVTVHAAARATLKLPDVGPEAYRLTIRDPGPAREPPIVIRARTRAGLHHALRTLMQLFRQYPGSLPTMDIDDGPAFPVRGVMLDISRDRVPTMEHLLATVDLLASLKINHLQLYTEHTFAYAGHEEVWQGWSPMTPDEVRTLDERCSARGITLAANQNCFGHLAQWLRHPRYAHLAETHGEWTFMDWPRSGPFSLCPVDPGSIELVDDLLGQLLPCFSSGLVNIGCDETFDVGQGRSRDEVVRRGEGGRVSVYLDFVRQICDRVRSRDFRPMFWADIALTHPESLGSLPEDLTALAWGYEPDAPFAEWCDRLRRARGQSDGEGGGGVWVCPGTSSWRSIIGRTAERRANLLAAATQGLANGASGFLVTDWGDCGHHQQWPIALHALAEAADAAWTGGAQGPFDPAASSLHAFGDESRAIGRWLDDLGDADADLRARGGVPAADGSPSPLRNASALFNDLHGHPSGDPNIPDPAAWRAVLDRLSDLSARMPAGLPEPTGDELAHTLAVARLAAEHGALKRDPGGLAPADRARLSGALDAIVEEHRRLWLVRSRPGGLDHSCTQYNKVRARIGPIERR